MKGLLFSLILAVFSAVSLQSAAADDSHVPASVPEGSGSKTVRPVLVELFTSESCASCPPAEQNLAYLQKEQPYSGAEIITLAFHVDYRDVPGWKDPFASPLFTQRQQVYDRKFRTGNIYTPQRVVDGDIEFIGSKLDKAESAIKRSLKRDKGQVELSVAGSKIEIRVRALPDTDYATVYLAYAEDGLTSSVRGGENAGKTLGHVAVVRSLNGIGRIEPGQIEFEMEAALNIGADWNREKLKAVVFVQENHTRKIVAAASQSLSVSQ
ncbi:MAG: DUF1223 domain-containing protein [Aridibacter famidurans]|nr:DUF1223 domain-containing protein [Aridibacter famidurans]